MSLWVVVGGQYGSEGKGKISAFITKQEDIDVCVRCGGPNSGHSFVDESGKTIVLKQEIEFLSLPPSRIGIDRNCFIIMEKDRQKEQTLGLGERLSSTLCGVGAALSRRILRGEDALPVKDSLHEYPWLIQYVTEVSSEINEKLDQGKKVLIEGTQGFGLSLYHSDHYPHTTSRDTTAAGFLSEVGVSPRLVTDIVVVFRTFPIRVAGQQAGPLKNEISWQELQRESGSPFLIEERTSVTHNVRRLGRFDWELAKQAVTVNRPTRLAINGLDYLNYRNRDMPNFDSLTVEAKIFIERMTSSLSCEVSYLGTGPRIDQILSETERAGAISNIRIAS